MKVALAATEIECFRTLVTRRFGLYFDEPRLDFLAEVVRQRISEILNDVLNSGTLQSALGARLAKL